VLPTRAALISARNVRSSVEEWVGVPHTRRPIRPTATNSWAANAVGPICSLSLKPPALRCQSKTTQKGHLLVGLLLKGTRSLAGS
jgi:hypothetical protein